MESPLREIDPEQLAEYSKALKDFKKTGVTQCIAILKDLLEVNLSINQLKETKIGPSLSKIAKEEIHDPDEKVLKDTAVQLFKKCKQRDDGQTGSAKKSELSRKDSSVSDITVTDENKRPSNEQKSENLPEPTILKKKSTTEEIKKEPKKENMEKKKEPENVSVMAVEVKDNESVAKLPLLSPEYRNFSLRSFVDGLLSDYKTKPSEKERLRPVANKKAVDIEQALSEKTKGNEQEYRMEARNLSTFLLMKNNLECRTRLMDGSAECKEFVLNKENFLNQQAKERIEEIGRRFIDANNQDYDKKIIRESQLYQCRKCKSKKISKTEKQTRSGDEPMTSFFTCVDCGAGWKE